MSESVAPLARCRLNEAGFIAADRRPSARFAFTLNCHVMRADRHASSHLFAACEASPLKLHHATVAEHGNHCVTSLEAAVNKTVARPAFGCRLANKAPKSFAREANVSICLSLTSGRRVQRLRNNSRSYAS